MLSLFTLARYCLVRLLCSLLLPTLQGLTLTEVFYDIGILFIMVFGFLGRCPKRRVQGEGHFLLGVLRGKQSLAEFPKRGSLFGRDCKGLTVLAGFLGQSHKSLGRAHNYRTIGR